MQHQTDKPDILVLYDTYCKEIFHYVLTRTGDVEIAGDIASEVFFKAHRSLWRFRFTGVPIGAWLFKIAGNEVTSYYRKQKYTPLCLEAVLKKSGGIPPALKGDLEEEILAAQEIVNQNKAYLKVKDLLFKLPKKYQEVIVLHYMEEKSIPEIAFILDKKEGTVKSLISRGIAKLKKDEKVVRPWADSSRRKRVKVS